MFRKLNVLSIAQWSSDEISPKDILGRTVQMLARFGRAGQEANSLSQGAERALGSVVRFRQNRAHVKVAQLPLGGVTRTLRH